VGPVPDDEVSFLRTRAAVTDGKGGLFFGYVDAGGSLHVLRFQPPSTISWDTSLGQVVNTRAFQVREDGAGGVLVAWVSAGSGSSGPRVELQRLSATGTITWDINATPGFIALALSIPAGSSAWLPDDWGRLAQAIPTRTGGALLVFEDFPAAAAKLFSVCFDATGVQLQGSVQEVSGRSGPQELPLLVATSTDGGVAAWSDESPGIAGSQVWANKIGCCDFFTGLPYPIPIPCELNSPEGGGFGDLPWWLPCGDRDGQYGFMTLMRLSRLGVNLPGCVVNRASPAPAWMRLSFRGVPPRTTIEVLSLKGKVLAKSRPSPFGLSLTFAPTSGAQDLLLVFRHRGPRDHAAPIPVRVEGSWGEGKPPAIGARRPRIAPGARGKSRQGRTRAGAKSARVAVRKKK
jgi:hypothetical protein